MKPIKVRVPREEAPDFADDLTAWSSATSVDPSPMVVGDAGTAGNTSSPIRYQANVSQSFFEQVPEWRMYVEQ
ncbi:hypothetical protein [Paraburkholderia aromaticivorans]|uniref:hypothetical protein n=1 Tax=Paraburkholderia aromaticivorans TaxID=2026199 RepID=UPI0014560ED5|nr:hypothetical protein [Paraburkholderia aromaticivorans]